MRPDIYISTTEQKEAAPYGVRVIENGNVELRFYAKVSLNGEYLFQQTMNRREVARLFLSVYDDCSFQELSELLNEVRDTRPNRDFSSIMLSRVDTIGLSQEASSFLSANNLVSVGDLVQKTEGQMQKLPNFNEFRAEISDRMGAFGLQYGMEIPNWSLAKTVFHEKVDELDLSIRSANCLKNEGIVFLGDLVQKSEADLLRTPNFGRKSVNELKEVLARKNLHLAMDVPNWAQLRKSL